MNNAKYQNSLKSETTVTCLQWTPKGSSPSETLLPGHIAGFDDYFRDAPGELASLLIGLTGNHRMEAISWLRNEAEQSGMDQHATEVKVGLFRSFRERINGVTDDGLPSDEYELIKATASLRNKFIDAWSKVVINCPTLDIQNKIDYLTAASNGDINNTLPISSTLFSKAVEEMHIEFQSARAIIFPAYPVAYANWKAIPARLIAFRADAIID